MQAEKEEISPKQEMIKLLKQLNNKLNSYELRATLYENKVYFTDNNGNTLNNDELKKRLDCFKQSLITDAKTATKPAEQRDFIKIFTMLKEDGLAESDLQRINKADNAMLSTFTNNAIAYLTNATFIVGEPLKQKENGGEDTALQGTNARLISKKKYEELWIQTRHEVLHMLTAAMKEDDHKKFQQVAKTGGTINTAGVTTEKKGGLVYVYTRTTGEEKGKGMAKGMFGISFTAEEVEKMRNATVNSLIELAKASEGELKMEKDGSVKFRGKELVSKDGKVDAQQYKEFLYVNRNKDEVKEKIRSNMMREIGQERWKEIESKAMEAYKKDYGPKKKMSIMGLAAGISYGVVMYGHQETKMEDTEAKHGKKNGGSAV